MDPQSRLMENMFKVDLFALIWIMVAIVVVTALAWHFYRGLDADDGPPAKISSTGPMPLKARWLSLVITAWWASDLIWHARAVVVTRAFYRPLLAPDLASPALKWAAELWQANPVLWDFATLIGDAALVLGLSFTFRHHPRWILWGATAWGFVRWILTAAVAPWGNAHPIGPGGFFLIAASAYLVMAPSHYRAIFGGAALLLAVDAGLTAHGPTHLGLGVGLIGLAYGVWRQWTATSFRILALFVTLDLLLQHVGIRALQGGLNQLWVPLMLLMAFGLHLSQEPRRHAKPIGG